MARSFPIEAHPRESDPTTATSSSFGRVAKAAVPAPLGGGLSHLRFVPLLPSLRPTPGSAARSLPIEARPRDSGANYGYFVFILRASKKDRP